MFAFFCSSLGKYSLWWTNFPTGITSQNPWLSSRNLYEHKPIPSVCRYWRATRRKTLLLDLRQGLCSHEVWILEEDRQYGKNVISDSPDPQVRTCKRCAWIGGATSRTWWTQDEKQASKQRIEGKDTSGPRWEEVCLAGELRRWPAWLACSGGRGGRRVDSQRW